MIGKKFKFFRKPEATEEERTPPGQYLTKGFPVLTYGETPHITQEEWQLRFWGKVAEKTFTWSDFMSLPQDEFTIDFHCVTRWSKLDVKWTGIKVPHLISQIELQPGVTHVMFHCYGGYTTNLTLEEFNREDNFFAHTLFGDPLPDEHGGPMRLVIPHLYAWKSAKWIKEIQFLDREELGFWERNGYHKRGEPWAEERYSF